jgi:DNA-binding MltR family transcriptional regulator
VVSQRKVLGALRGLTQKRSDDDTIWMVIQSFTSPGFGGKSLNALANALINPWRDHTDRATALVLTAILEQTLEDAICGHFVTMDEADRKLLFSNPNEMAPLQSMYAKIRIGYALGIYGSGVLEDLQCINLMRNAFAHTKIHLEFEDENISVALQQTNLYSKFPWGGKTFPKPEKARDIFIECIRVYVTYFSTKSPIRYDKMDLLKYLFS